MRSTIGEARREMRANVAQDLCRLRKDASLSLRDVATALGIDYSLLARYERGERLPGLETLVSLGVVFGAPVELRFRPGSGPVIADRLQAARIEAFLRAIHPAWPRSVEQPVGRPGLGGGVIDVVLAHPRDALLVAIESEGEIRRLEQTIRWQQQKADALRYSPLARTCAGRGRVRIERILLLAATHHNVEVVRAHQETLRAAFPSRLRACLDAFADPAWPFPGSTLLWLGVGDHHLLTRPPNGVGVGR